ncbi:unnamed protein product [Didymodactylos carnosus]|uniref:MARVEL domain-containing protein n=1 Tax=Didymodactylos carnosus TaxID=1234261 RepID=A0A814FCQ9_9BILA|nr:unnamed protein product [Didymodactylos carnosus]CAF0978196.1 unnamed protein product [Didymodactylos carnosus]CAF3530768.1 unnamed protein product [Didymodactylos carnosus]CAF3750994.1 unnamed protein product [Didymodactylos carnosus]
MYVKQQQPQQQQPVGYVQPYQLETDKWREKFPASVPSLLAVLQLLLTLSIVGLEAASVYYDLVHGTIYAGFWCSAIFTISWIAMFGLRKLDVVIYYYHPFLS